jgi:hypothetical protein
MAQKTSWTGATLTETDIVTYLSGEGGAWTTWTPTVTQPGAVTVTVNHAVYGRWGRLIVAHASLSVTGTGTASNGITLSVPVNAARSGMGVGAGTVYDVSATTNYSGTCYTSSASSFVMYAHGTVSVASPVLGGAVFTAALAAGDVITFTLQYEAAS